MDLSDRTKILILIAIIAIVIFFFLQNRSGDEDDQAIHNQGSLTHNLAEVNDKNITDKDVENERLLNQQDIYDIEREIKAEENLHKQSGSKKMKHSETVQESPENNVALLKKFKTRNSSRDGNFISSSFADGKRGGGKANDLDKFFEEGHPLEQKIGFQTSDPNSGDIQYANYVPGKQRTMRDVDKFNAEAMLPKEKHKDWFDDPYESTSVKNTHLINIYRPIGINTVSTTLKNANRQLRADPACPKVQLGPFLNSSIEPDTNIRSQSLCE